mmetsp:Transcript_20022/g.23221  ORF Transcript_20022/g.23221 Transcript_20022/m.23221 type:complete len:118 (+) Transcript_20022:639-992(+)
MNQHIHYMLNSAYFAYSLFLVAIVLVIIRPSWFNFEHYTFISVFWMCLSGVTHYVGQTLNSLAYKYAEASKITPLTYTGGVILMLADILVFGYAFNLTDVTGILIIFFALLLQIICK